MMRIRAATHLDRDDVCAVHLCAFSEVEGQKVSALAANLLREETNPETISLVADFDGAVVGHIAFSPVSIGRDQKRIGYILAPLAVRPDYQQRHIGSALIESGMERLWKMNVGIVFVYGDPGFYGRFGFTADLASRFQAPYELEFPSGWQAIALDPDLPADPGAELSCVSPLRDPELW